MSKIPFSVEPQLKSQSSNHELWLNQPVHLLKLKGYMRKRAEAHGRLLGNELSDSVIRYFVSKTLGNLPRLLKTPGRLGFRAIGRRMLSQAPRAMRDEIDIYAAASPFNRDELTTALITPDLGCMAFSLLKHPAAANMRLAFGCSSLAAPTAEGGFLFARNLDFPSVGFFDQHPCVTVHQPSEAGELARVSIAADGIHFASISAINEAGIGLVVHQNFSSVASSKGVPLLLVGDYIMRKAKSLAQASEILEKYHPGPLWTVMLFDMLRGETVVAESSKEFTSFRSNTDGLCQTNHCLSERGQAVEMNQWGSHQNSIFRYKIAEQALLEIKKLPHERAVRRAADFLAYQESYGCDW